MTTIVLPLYEYYINKLNIPNDIKFTIKLFFKKHISYEYLDCTLQMLIYNNIYGFLDDFPYNSKYRGNYEQLWKLGGKDAFVYLKYLNKYATKTTFKFDYTYVVCRNDVYNNSIGMLLYNTFLLDIYDSPIYFKELLTFIKTHNYGLFNPDKQINELLAEERRYVVLDNPTVLDILLYIIFKTNAKHIVCNKDGHAYQQLLHYILDNADFGIVSEDYPLLFKRNDVIIGKCDIYHWLNVLIECHDSRVYKSIDHFIKKICMADNVEYAKKYYYNKWNNINPTVLEFILKNKALTNVFSVIIRKNMNSLSFDFIKKIDQKATIKYVLSIDYIKTLIKQRKIKMLRWIFTKYGISHCLYDLIDENGLNVLEIACELRGLSHNIIQFFIDSKQFNDVKNLNIKNRKARYYIYG